jgi:hypothetical protein
LSLEQHAVIDEEPAPAEITLSCKLFLLVLHNKSRFVRISFFQVDDYSTVLSLGWSMSPFLNACLLKLDTVRGTGKEHLQPAEF